MRRPTGWLAAALAAGFVSSQAPAADLTFDDRVRAQEAIERVYYRHQLEAKLHFEQAVPRASLESKVGRFLARAEALVASQKGPTAEDLVAELERIATHTRFPSRLREIYAALGNDPVLVLECFVRPALTERLHPDSVAPVRHEIASLASPGARLPAPAALTGAPPDDTWSPGGFVQAPRHHELHTAVWTGSLMIVWGGTIWPSGSVAPSTVPYGSRYDPITNGWSDVSLTGAPSVRTLHTAVWTGQEMVVWGGSAGAADPYTSTGGRYDPATDTWTPTAGNSGRRGHIAVWTGSRMLVWGGRDASGLLGTGASYDPAANTWTPLSTGSAPSPREGHSAVWTGTRMIVWGGSVTNTGAVYDPATDVWEATEVAGAPQARSSHRAVWTGSEMVVWGGSPDGVAVLNTGGRYDPVNEVWSPTSIAGAPAARSRHVAIWTGSRMLIWGGRILFEPGGAYDPGSDTWTAISTAGAPQGRTGPSAVWTGTEMIVWGGNYGGRGDAVYPANTGGRYDPQTDTWRPTTLGGRARHGAVWTGNAMLIWGGKDQGLDILAGERYDPLLDAWSEMSVTGAPLRRDNFSSIWTGQHMIVWGGQASQFVQTGGRYDPITDAWAPTSVQDAPSARSAHSVVWSGSEMIVWGGSNGPAIGTGGRYDPATDQWTPVSGVGAPIARHGHVAAWTGNRMVVWGGQGQGPTYFADGALYDPQTDAWMPMAAQGAPSTRSYAASVWSGRHFVVWGGRPPAFPPFLSDGARYDPATDTWSPTSSAGAPADLAAFAVWTGGRMVVWGTTSTTGTPAGGRYDPEQDAWTPVSAVGAPTAQSGYSAVWTGSELVLFGGAGYVYSNDGRHYAVSTDTDGDGVLDPQDCDPWDGTVTTELPDEAGGLVLGADKTSLSWMPVSQTAVHDVARGLLSTLPVGGEEICLVRATLAASTSDAAEPPPGQGFFYLVRGRNACGVGGWGAMMGGAPRTTGACP